MGILSKLFNWLKPKKATEGEDEYEIVGYRVRHLSETMEDVEELFAALELDHYWSIIEPLVKPVIELELHSSNESTMPVYASKIGGKPSLPKNFHWPKTKHQRSMSFIAQINMADIKAHDEEDLFPEDGLISFFYCADQDAWGFDPEDKYSFEVTYFNPELELYITDFPEDLDAESIFKSNAVKFNKGLSVPTWEHYAIAGVIDNDDYDNYFDAIYGLKNQILGYANPIQDTMELECQLVTNGIYCGNPEGYKDPRRKALERGQKDWILLLQIDSEEDKTGMLWGDAGKLYFWIKKQDLKARKFENAWCILQCY